MTGRIVLTSVFLAAAVSNPKDDTRDLLWKLSQVDLSATEEISTILVELAGIDEAARCEGLMTLADRSLAEGELRDARDWLLEDVRRCRRKGDAAWRLGVLVVRELEYCDVVEETLEEVAQLGVAAAEFDLLRGQLVVDLVCRGGYDETAAEEVGERIARRSFGEQWRLLVPYARALAMADLNWRAGRVADSGNWAMRALDELVRNGSLTKAVAAATDTKERFIDVGVGGFGLLFALYRSEQLPRVSKQGRMALEDIIACLERGNGLSAESMRIVEDARGQLKGDGSHDDSR